MAVLDDIYNAFNPMPLPAGAAEYVDFRSVRGGSDVVIELGRKACTRHLLEVVKGGGSTTDFELVEGSLECVGGCDADGD